MAQFLTEEWLTAVLGAANVLPVRDGVNANLMFEVAAAPSGKMRIDAEIVDGRLTRLAEGKNADAECTVVLDAAFAADIVRGDVDPEVAYMRGDVKLNDAYERVLFDLRPMTRTPEWTEMVAAVVAMTDWPASR